jgi:hypothetical protein
MRILVGGTGVDRAHFLHVQHDNDPSGARQLSRQGEFLVVGQTVHFDVVLVWADFPMGPGKAHIVRFEYADPAIANASERPLGSGQVPQSWILGLQVSGWTDYRDVAPADGIFKLEIDKRGLPSLQQVAKSATGSSIS